MNAILGALPWAVGIWIAACGMWGVMTSRNLVHMVICLNLLKSASCVLLVGVGWRAGGSAPYFSSPAAGTPVDPIVQALLLTDVVVEVTVFGLLLALVLEVHQRVGTLDPNDLRSNRG